VDCLDDQNRTIAILDIGGVYLGTDQQTAGKLGGFPHIEDFSR